MAARTIRLIGRRRPGDGLCVTFVASGTSQITAVVAWIGPRVVAETGWGPANSVMAAVTLQVGDKMIAGLACGLAAIVAIRTGAGYIDMIKACR